MKRRFAILLVVVLAALLSVIPAAADETSARGTPGVIYVTSQGLY